MAYVGASRGWHAIAPVRRGLSVPTGTLTYVLRGTAVRYRDANSSRMTIFRWRAKLNTLEKFEAT